jgi:hypothetical protein
MNGSNVSLNNDVSLSETEAELLAAALHYAQMGWKIFPIYSVDINGRCTCGKEKCKSIGKHPRTSNGLKSATHNVDIIQYWWSVLFVGSNIAVRCDGEFWVLDVDPRHGGDTSLYGLEMTNGKLPRTVTSLTGGGGQHYLFRKPQASEICSRANDSGELSGLDSRSNGGYIVLPPSQHKSGQRYEWQADYAPGDIELARSPVWLDDAFEKKSIAKKAIKKTTVIGNAIDGDFSNDKIDTLLDTVDPDMGYSDWISVGMALHSDGNNFELWDNWSSRGSKYEGSDNCRTHWNSFSPGEITMGTLIHMAKEAGWVGLPAGGSKKPNIPVAPTGKVAALAPPNPYKPSPPDGYLVPPGIAKDMADYMTGLGKMPQPIFSVGAAITLMSTVLGNKFATETGLRPNIMIVSIGPTSCGKDAARKGIKEIMSRSELTDRIGGEDVSSGSALESAMGIEANSLFLFDEFGMMLKAINEPKAAPYLREIGSMLMKMFSSSGSTYIGKAYADPKARPRTDITNPNLSVYAATTSEKLDEALGSGDAASGFLNRFLFVETDTPVPDPQVPSSSANIPQQIIDWIEAVNAIEKPFERYLLKNVPLYSGPVIVSKSEHARTLIDEFEDWCIKRRRKQDDELEHALWGRAVELVDKVAMILAVGESPETLIVEMHHAHWAIEFVTWSIKLLARRVSEFVSDNETEASIKKLIRFVGAATNYATDKHYARACAAGVMPHGKLLKLMKMNSRDFRELISTVLETGQIELMKLDAQLHGVEGLAYRTT